MMRPPVGRIRVYVLLVDGARRSIAANLRDGFHQVSIDRGIFRRITNGADRILTLPYFFQLAKHHLTQQNDAAVGSCEALGGSIGDRPLSFPCHMILRLRSEEHTSELQSLAYL